MCVCVRVCVCVCVYVCCRVLTLEFIEPSAAAKWRAKTRPHTRVTHTDSNAGSTQAQGSARVSVSDKQTVSESVVPKAQAERWV